ncbi:MAG: ABC transporter ATP-binding protein [bacterium]|nr:ABC transporter ATP-binding protein [bacterium]
MLDQINTKGVLRQYWRMIKGFRWPFVFTVVIIVLASALGVVFPWVYKLFFDALTDPSLSKDQVVTELLRVLVLLGALHLIAWVFWRISGFASMWIYPRAEKKIRIAAFDYLMKHSYRFFSNRFSGALVRKLNRFADSFGRIGEKVQWELVPLIVSSIGITIVLSFRNIWLSVVILVWIGLFILLNVVLSTWKLRYDMRRAAADSIVTGILSDTITNATNVKLFSAYEYEHTKYQGVVEDHRRLWQFTWGLSEAIMSAQVILMIAVEIVMMYVGINLWKEGLLTVGDFALIQGYLIALFNKLWDFGRTIRDLYERIADATEMANILDMPHEVLDTKSAVPVVVKKGEIDFQNVFFNYHKTRKILSDFSLKIKPGEKVALVGPSGAGKSTVTKLLLRLFDVSRGKVLIDGQNIAKVTMESLWEQVSLVPQEPILFHRTIMDNIRYGDRDSTDEEVVSAAKKARCHEFIEMLPMGYDTFVGERGVKLSGGERQRVAIARAILKNAPILVLDEATSSLDSESESLIQAALHELMKGKTTIVIAHRLSTVMQMDRIVVIESGKVVDTRTHKELLKRHGTYKKLWEIQAGGFVN